MSRRIESDLKGLTELGDHCGWYRRKGVVGGGPQCVVDSELHCSAFACRPGQANPVIHPGPWHVRIVLEHALVVQPTVRILPSADDFLPVGANILDWLDCHDMHACRELAGAVCYAEHWYSQLTLVWIAYQTARIVVGELLNLEAAPLSMRGREFQAAMLAEGKLPTQVLAAPPAALLSVNGLSSVLQNNHEVEFLEG